MFTLKKLIANFEIIIPNLEIIIPNLEITISKFAIKKYCCYLCLCLPTDG